MYSIFTYTWLICRVNIPYMDPMGKIVTWDCREIQESDIKWTKYPKQNYFESIQLQLHDM